MEFFVCITLLTPMAADQVIAGLVKRGFNVALAEADFHGHQLVVLTVSDAHPADDGEDYEEYEYEATDLDLVKAAIVQTITEYQIKHFSYVIISGNAVMTWAAGNLDLATRATKQDPQTLFEHVTGE
jgi:hypothetical protein